MGEKNGFVLSMLCIYLYTSHMSTCQCLSANCWRVNGGDVNLAHLSCTFSKAFLSLTMFGFHTGLPYSSMGPIIA